MNYLKFLQKGLRFVVKAALKEVETNSLSGEHHFFITFKTKFPGVKIDSSLVEKYPESMTIVLQHEFWNLRCYENHFTVDLLFAGVEHNLMIPFCAIYKFEDPSESFALDFIVDEALESFNSEENKEENNNIIKLDAFRIDKDLK